LCANGVLLATLYVCSLSSPREPNDASDPDLFL
jgi:hypothetical protein